MQTTQHVPQQTAQEASAGYVGYVYGVCQDSLSGLWSLITPIFSARKSNEGLNLTSDSYHFSHLLKDILPVVMGRAHDIETQPHHESMLKISSDINAVCALALSPPERIKSLKNILKENLEVVSNVMTATEEGSVFSSVLSSLPQPLQEQIHFALKTQQSSWFSWTARMVFPLCNKSWKTWLIDQIPDTIFTSAFAQTGAALRMNFNAQLDEIKPFDGDSLWHMGADFLVASNPTLESSDQVREWKEALKKQVPGFRQMIESGSIDQGDILAKIEPLVEASHLPPSLQSKLNTAFNSMKTHQNYAIAQAILLMLGSDLQKWVIDQLPDELFTEAATILNEQVKLFDPATEFPFVQTFAKLIQDSIKVKALREFAGDLTQNYYKYIAAQPEDLFSMAIPVLRLGSQATPSEQLGAFAQHAGICFQKGMQLFGDDIKDVEFKSVLDQLKQDIEPMSKEALRAILDQDQASNGPLARLGITLDDIEPEPIKSATIGQVHKAKMKERVELYVNSHKEVIIQEKIVAVKIMRPHLRERIEREFGMLYSAASSPAIRATLLDLKASILEETDFEHEAENARIAAGIYTHSQKKTGGLHVAKVIDQSTNIMVQEFVQGKSIQSYYKGYFKEGQEFAKADFLNTVGKLLNIELQVWINAVFNGHVALSNGAGHIEGDRHGGNQLFDYENKQLNLIDFGAATPMTRIERKALEKLSLGVVFGRPKMVRHAITVFLPEIRNLEPAKKRELDNALAKVVSRATQDEKVDNIIDTLTDPEFNVTVENISETLKGLSEQDIKVLLNKKQPAIALALLINHFPEIQENDALKDALSKVLVESHSRVLRFHPRKWLVNNVNQVLIMNTNKRIMDVLFSFDLKAPKALVQLHRGSKFIEDQIRHNNKEKALHSKLMEDKGLLNYKVKAQLKQDNIGNIYASAAIKGKLASLFRRHF